MYSIKKATLDKIKKDLLACCAAKVGNSWRKYADEGFDVNAKEIGQDEYLVFEDDIMPGSPVYLCVKGVVEADPYGGREDDKTLKSFEISDVIIEDNCRHETPAIIHDSAYLNLFAFLAEQKEINFYNDRNENDGRLDLLPEDEVVDYRRYLQAKYPGIYFPPLDGWDGCMFSGISDLLGELDMGICQSITVAEWL